MAFWGTGAVACAEEHGTRTENIGLNSSSAQVTLRCAWNLRFNLCAAVLGTSWPGLSGLVASSASIKGDSTQASKNVQELVYIHALCTFNFTTDDLSSQTLISEQLTPVVEFLQLDYKRFRWGAADGDALTEEEAPGKQVRMMQLTRTEYQVDSIHTDEHSKVGYTNDAAYASAVLGITFEEDTLLYEGMQIDHSMDTLGAHKWTLHKSFMYDPTEWNKFWRAKTQAWESIFIQGGAQYFNYVKTSFANIL